MFAATADTTNIWLLIAAVAAIVTLVAAVPYIGRGRAIATIKLQASEITARDEAIIHRDQVIGGLRTEIVDSERRCDEKLHEQDRRHTAEIAELRGRLDATTPEFARSIAAYLRDEGVRG